ncbi:MAG: beta-galactosidase [Planctomycetia bacterium]|nr:beta-galactosidase [Planctomycetia bacterium]
MWKRVVGGLLVWGWVACGWGQMLDRTDSRVQTTLAIEWKCLGTIQPRGVTEIPGEQMWTLGCETLCRDYIYWDTYKEYVAPLGIKKIRLQAGWAKTEQERGKFDFTWLDAVVDDALARGLEPMLETSYGNPIYPGGGDWDLGAGFPVSEEGLAAWEVWVETLAKHYRDRVKIWMMWNEPDIGKKKTPEEIVHFNIRTAEIIRRIIPDSRIGALSLARNSPEFLEKCLKVLTQEKKEGLFEWMIYHGYAKNPDSSYKNVEAMREVMNRYVPQWKLWQGENGCPSEMAHRFALSNHPWSELTQAKWNTRRMLGDWGHDVLSAVFTICDFDHKGREINRKGLLKINDKRNLAKVKMAYYSVQNVVAVWDGTLERQKDYRCEIVCEVPITWYAARDEKKGEDVLVFWDGNQIPGDSNETHKGTITVEKGLFSDPVWADLITGRIYEIPAECKEIQEGKMVLKNVPVYDAPAIIADRNRLIQEK